MHEAIRARYLAIDECDEAERHRLIDALETLPLGRRLMWEAVYLGVLPGRAGPEYGARLSLAEAARAFNVSYDRAYQLLMRAGVRLARVLLSGKAEDPHDLRVQ